MRNIDFNSWRRDSGINLTELEVDDLSECWNFQQNRIECERAMFTGFLKGLLIGLESGQDMKSVIEKAISNYDQGEDCDS